MLKNNPNSPCRAYFTEVANPNHRQYLALRDFFAEDLTAEQVAQKHGYSVSTVYSMTRDFKRTVNTQTEDPFFKAVKVGRKPIDREGEIAQTVVNLRKKYLSVPDIQAILDAQGSGLSIYAIEKILTDAGFDRLPRRDKQERLESAASGTQNLVAPKACRLKMEPERFSTPSAGILSMIPTIIRFDIHKAIERSSYPHTKEISRLSAILSFVALKLSNVKRYSADDIWCMDRGAGLFAGLNVLPKAAWFSSYSSGITREMNVAFLKSLQQIWPLGDTANLDFTAIPYWGDDEPFENNWSGKRGRALTSIQAVLAQDPDTGIICYGDTTVRHNTQDNTVLNFLDFYGDDPSRPLKYLIFDSKFTTYQNLCKINKRGIKFITVRRRSASLVGHIDSLDTSKWKKFDIEKTKGTRVVFTCEEYDELKDYEGLVRQVYIKSPGRQKPAIIITNDFDIPLKQIVRKYARRWLVETEIAEHIDFFHLNRNCSGIVIKVDFDLSMTILAHNLLRLFCKDMDAYSNCYAGTLHEKFLSTPGEVVIDDTDVTVTFKKKRTLPCLLEHLNDSADLQVPWLKYYRLNFAPGSSS